MTYRNRTGLILAVLCTSAIVGGAQRPRIGVDQRVELMSVVFRLAGNPEYNQGRVPSYEKAIESHFARFRDHEAVRSARALRESNGVSFDGVMSMAIHLADASQLRERLPFTRSGIMLDERWGGDAARAFLTPLRRFVQDARFAAFVQSQQRLYAITNERLQSFAEHRVDLKWFSSFYGTHLKAQFILAPGLANGGASYGPRFVAANEAEEFWSIVGVDTVDAAGLPLFDDRKIPTVLHEFSHSFVNPVVAKHTSRLEPAGVLVYSAVAELMKRRAYGHWKVVVDESLVRAAVARYVLEHDGPEGARTELHQQWSQGFVWIEELFDLLAVYERERDRYSDLDAFMPRIAQYFEALAPRVSSLVERYEGARPRVISMVPENGSTTVSPDIDEIVWRFDRPMKDRYSVIVSPACGKTCYPEVLGAGFDATGTIFTMRVRLQPERDYEFSLNSDNAGSFQSVDGIPLRKHPVRFRTTS